MILSSESGFVVRRTPGSEFAGMEPRLFQDGHGQEEQTPWTF
ncbi:MAG TPA: hypothetical protein VGF27_09795 [Pseudoduganella sp.]